LGLGGGGAAGRFVVPGPFDPTGLLIAGGVFLDASFSFLAFCVQSGQVTSLAFAD